MFFDYYDQLKSRTRGYVLFDYDLAGFKPGDLSASTFSWVASPSTRSPRSSTAISPDERGRAPLDKLREEIPRQMFDIPIQAAVGSRVDRAGDRQGKRKDVLAKCYGGDITRKRKLLEKQKAGKKRMKQVGAVEVPQEAFLAVLEHRPRPALVSATARHSTSTFPSARTAAAIATSSRSSAGEPARRYVDALLQELELERGLLAEELETVFLGGGTPTFTVLSDLVRLLEALPGAGK